MFVETEPISWIETLIRYGPLAPAYVAVFFLWRALQASQLTNQAWQEKSFEHLSALNQIPQSLDRLRYEVLAGQKETAQTVSIALDRCSRK